MEQASRTSSVLSGVAWIALLILGWSAAHAAERVVTFTNPEIIQAGRDTSRLDRVDRDLVTGQNPVSVKVPPPGIGPHNPSFVENGLHVEAFWAIDVGRKSGHFIAGHFHPKDLSTGFEGQHYGARRELHGLFIRATNGKPLTLKSLNYRVTKNRELGRNLSIDRFSIHDVSIFVGTSFDPTQPLLGQLIPFSVGPPIGNDITLPFFTLVISGFEGVTELFIASSTSVDFDDIVVEVPD
jgi:hypothetical protein